jgi:hypothetical protein
MDPAPMSSSSDTILVCITHDAHRIAPVSPHAQGMPHMTFYIVVASAGGGVVLLAALLATWCCVRRRSRSAIDLSEKAQRADSSDTLAGPHCVEPTLKVPRHLSDRPRQPARARTTSNPSLFISRPMAPISPSPHMSAQAPRKAPAALDLSALAPGPGPYPVFHARRASASLQPRSPPPIAPLPAPPRFRVSLVPPPTTPATPAPALPRRSSKRVPQRRVSADSASVYSVASAPWDKHDDARYSRTFTAAGHALVSAPPAVMRFPRPHSPSDTLASSDADGPEYHRRW